MKMNQRKRIISLLSEVKSQERYSKRNLMNRETKAGPRELDKLRSITKETLLLKGKTMGFNSGAELLRSTVKETLLLKEKTMGFNLVAELLRSLGIILKKMMA